MKVEERQNGYDITTHDALGDELVRGLARNFENVRYTGNFWAVNYGMDISKNEALQRAVKRTKSRYQKEWTAAILHAPQTVGEIKPLPALAVEIPVRRPLYPFQGPGVQYNLDHKKAIIGDQPGLGKAQPIDAKIATPFGWLRMGDARPGLDVYGADGKVYQITDVFPQGILPAFRITFNDGTFAECCEEHLWSVRDVNRRRRGNGWTVKTTKELLAGDLRYRENELRTTTGRKSPLKWEIPLAAPFDRSKRPFIIPPYILGVMLGDGSLCGGRIAISIPDVEAEIKERIEGLLPKGFALYCNRAPACPIYYITHESRENSFIREIKRLGLNVKGGEKFIPEEYLFGSYSQRLELLRGLMDSDGSAARNRVTFHTKAPGLAKGVADLVFSLGGQAIIRPYDRTKDEKGIEYQVNVKIGAACPFLLERKVQQWSPAARNYASRYIESIEWIGDVPQQCIAVNAPDSLYLTDSFIVTHNTTIASATLLAGRMDARFQTLPALIVCPTTIKRKWQRELMDVTGYRALILNDKYRNTWPRLINSGLIDAVVVNFESLRKFFVQAIHNPPGVDFRLKDVVFRPEINLFKTLIVDEIHRAKDYTTQTAKFLKGISEAKNIEYVFGLTGTMLVNKPDDLIAQLSIIGRLHEFGGLTKFKARYCTTVERYVETLDEASGKMIPEKKKVYPNLEELNYFLTERCFYRREKKDVLKDLPDKTRQIISIDITNRPEYDQAEHRFEEYLKTIKNCSDFEIARKMRAQALVQMGVLGEISARGKMAAVKEWGDNLIESGEKIVLFSELQDVIQKTMGMFENCLEISGRVTGDRRDRNVNLFQNSPAHMAITCNIKAGGVGIDLFASSHVGFIQLPWHFADLEQCEDRTHRNGQKNAVLSGLFLGVDTVDEYRWQKIQDKRSIANQVHGAPDEISDEAVDGLLAFFAKRKRKQTAQPIQF